MPANRNKKTEKAFHAEARNTWSRKPVTQVVGSRKAYNRKKDKMEFHRTLKQGNDGIPFYYLFVQPAHFCSSCGSDKVSMIYSANSSPVAPVFRPVTAIFFSYCPQISKAI